MGVTLLFTVFAIFIFENIKCIKSETKSDESKISYCTKEKVSCIILFILGAVGIIFGAKLLVKYATQIAISLNISQRVISVIAVAIGTSLPGSNSSYSTKEKFGSLSAGNILGANIIDLTLILPICSLISITKGSGELAVSLSCVNFDCVMCLGVILIAVLPTIISQKFQRWQGILLLIIYGIYIYFVVR